jgi:cell division protein FtsI/penicillin-binding protein 2
MATQLTEKKIQKILNGFFCTYKYSVDNLYVFPWESDKLIWTKAGYIYEFEIKISRADYRNDFKHKADKHLLFSSKIKKQPESLQQDLFANLQKREQKKYPQITVEQAKRRCYPENTKLPNYFYYVVPEGLIRVEEVPEYAGLIWIQDDWFCVKKKAPCLHKEKYTDAQLNLGEKFYYNWETAKRTLKQVEENVKYHKAQLDLELAAKGQECTYEELQRKLKDVERSSGYWETMYLTMVEGADYNSVERRLLISKIKELYPRFDYSAFMKEVDEKYKEKYPDRSI